MKAIKIEDKIISLENVREVEIHDYGMVNAKRDPYCCWVNITYTDDKIAKSPKWDKLEIAKDWLDKIFTTLTAD